MMGKINCDINMIGIKMKRTMWYEAQKSKVSERWNNFKKKKNCRKRVI